MLCTNSHNLLKILQHFTRTFTLSIVHPLMEIHIMAILKFPTPISCNCIHESMELHVSVLKHTILKTECKPPYIIKWVKSHPLPMSAWQHPSHCTCHEQCQQPEHASLVPSWRCKERFLWLYLCKMKLLKGYIPELFLIAEHFLGHSQEILTFTLITVLKLLKKILFFA